MILLKVSGCALAQAAIIAKQMFTDDLNHFFYHIGTYMEFIFFARRGLLLERSHVARGEGEYTTVKTRGLLLLSR